MYLRMIGPQYKPATQQKGEVEYSSTHNESQYARYGEPQREEQHVVLVKIAEKPENSTQLGKLC